MRRDLLTPLVACLVVTFTLHSVQAELIEYDDAADSVLAATLIGSNNVTGWNDPALYAGDVFGYRYHILVAIKDTTAIKSLLAAYVLDSAALSAVVAAVSGSPGALTLHHIHRDSSGTGVYPAYDDNPSSYCRSRWYERKGALPTACPDPIAWETPGATGASDYDSLAFNTLPNPSPGQRYDIDVTPWIAGIVAGNANTSNGIILLASGENGAGTDYISIRHIHPFFTGADRLILRIWRSLPAPNKPRAAWIDSPSSLK